MENGHRMCLANSAAIQEYQGLKYTGDDSDARWLARLIRLGVLAEGYIYRKEERPVRDLLRERSQLVHQKTANFFPIVNLLGASLLTLELSCYFQNGIPRIQRC